MIFNKICKIASDDFFSWKQSQFRRMEKGKGNSNLFLIIKVQILRKACSLCGIFSITPVFQLFHWFSWMCSVLLSLVQHMWRLLMFARFLEIRCNYVNIHVGVCISSVFSRVFSMMHPTQLFICTGHTSKNQRYY